MLVDENKLGSDFLCFELIRQRTNDLRKFMAAIVAKLTVNYRR